MSTLQQTPTPASKSWLWICAFLFISTLLVYWPVTRHDFVNFDDTDYVTTNTVVQAGLTKQSVAWAFKNDVARNWHPVTLMSHMVDCQLYGLKPGGHHLTNVLFHLANTLLVFLLLKQMTGALWRSAVVAGLFALHPLHVESVAWVAERKDVLSTFFWLLTTWAFFCYAKAPKPSRSGLFYGVALILFALGLMSKPMLVTLPCTLLLLDFWPWRRVATGVPWSRLIIEKLPFFAMSAAACCITFSVQHAGGAVLSTSNLSLSSRVGNALVSYVRYLEKMIWPQDLAGLYLRMGDWPPALVAGAAVLLCAVSVAVVRWRKAHGYLAVGWFWYLGTLVPVIGLVQVGMQSMADRYTYVPLIGVFIALAWGGAELLKKWRWSQFGIGCAIAAVLLACLVVTHLQLRHWRDSETLFLRMIAVSNKNYMAHYNLGNFYSRAEQLDQAIAHYQAAVDAEPSYANAHNNLGGALLKARRFDEAIAHYKKAAQSNPDCVQYFNLGNAFADAGRLDEAINSYREALSLTPGYAQAYVNMGSVLNTQGKIQEAIAAWLEALKLKPELEVTELSLGNAFASLNRIEEAIAHYQAARHLDPNRADTYNGLGICFAMQGKYAEAATQFEQVLRLRPEDLGALSNLGNALAAQNKFDEAASRYAAALKINPNDYQTHFNLGFSLARQNQTAAAAAHYQEALRLKPDYAEAQRALASLKLDSQGAK